MTVDLHSSPPSYPVPATAVEHQIEIKKSRFIARIARASDRQQAMEQLAQAKADYPDARHHCWAYLLGPGQSPVSQAFSDDGEPNGTAGKPILNVLQHKGIGDLMLIVIRYFGGIKLGAGGLVRAYSQAAQTAMELLVTEQQQPRLELKLICDFAQEQPLRHWCSLHDGELVEIHYGAQVEVTLTLPYPQLDPWRAYAASQQIVFSQSN